MDIDKLIAMVHHPQQVGTLSTADLAGCVNSALFGSARFSDKGKLIIAMGHNRSLRNLQHNPKAVFTVSEPGPNLLAWKGGRIYLEALSIEKEGALFEEAVQHVTETAGSMAGKMIKAAVVFKVTDFRPLLDFDNQA